MILSLSYYPHTCFRVSENYLNYYSFRTNGLFARPETRSSIRYELYYVSCKIFSKIRFILFMTKYCYQMLFLLVVSSGDVFICNIFEQTKYTQLTNPVVCCINIEYYGFWLISSGKHVYLTMRIQNKLWIIYSDHAICAQRMGLNNYGITASGKCIYRKLHYIFSITCSLTFHILQCI